MYKRYNNILFKGYYSNLFWEVCGYCGEILTRLFFSFFNLMIFLAYNIYIVKNIVTPVPIMRYDLLLSN